MTVGIDSYISVLEFQTYCNSRGITIPSNIEQLLIKASDYLTGTFYGNILGTEKEENQELLFPRVDEYGNDIDETSLKKAVCSLALRADTESLFIDSDKRVTKEKLDVLEVTYASDGVDKKRFSDVYNFMRPYLINSGTTKKVVR